MLKLYTHKHNKKWVFMQGKEEISRGNVWIWHKKDGILVSNTFAKLFISKN